MGGGWLDFPLYELHRGNKGNKVMVGDKAATIYAGIWNYEMRIGEHSIRGQWQEEGESEGEGEEMLGKWGKEGTRSSKWLIYFTSAGTALLFVASLVFFCGWWYRSFYTQLIGCAIQGSSATFYLAGIAQYAKGIGLGDGFCLFIFAAFGVLVGTGITLYGLMELSRYRGGYRGGEGREGRKSSSSSSPSSSNYISRQQSALYSSIPEN